MIAPKKPPPPTLVIIPAAKPTTSPDLLAKASAIKAPKIGTINPIVVLPIVFSM